MVNWRLQQQVDRLARDQGATAVRPVAAAGTVLGGDAGRAVVPPDTDWFPVRIASFLTGPDRYLFVEQWLQPDGVWADKPGGRANTAEDYAYLLSGVLAGADTALCRRSEGAGGQKWELARLGPPAASAARLTETVGIASGRVRQLSSGSWIDSTTLPNNVYPVQIESAPGSGSAGTFAVSPGCWGATWPDPASPAQWHFLPFQYAGLHSGTYYPGFVSTGTQAFAGAKTFAGAVTMESTLQVNGVVTVGVSGAGTIVVSQVNCNNVDVIMSGGGVTLTAPNGSRWLLSISNAGTIVITAL